MRLGIFGGSFDPVHFGHLRCAEEVREILNIDRIVFVPAGRPPHKKQEELSPFLHRYEMVKLAIENHPFFEVSEEEGIRGGISYSIDTVIRFKDSYPVDRDIFFITGQDAFEAIRTWRDWDRLLNLCHFVVMTRPGYGQASLEEILSPEVASRYSCLKNGCYTGPEGYDIYFIRVTFLDIEGRLMRKWIKEGRSIAFLTPDSVVKYIVTHQLYM
jgi:nicotinate-nucleotide adenylyltransferase